MSTSPQFTATPKAWVATVSSTADGTVASHTPTGGTTTLVTPGSSGSKVEEVICTGYGTSLAGLINLWLYVSSTYYLFDQVKFLGVAGSTTLQGERQVRQYANLLLPSGTTLVVTSAVANQRVDVCAFGGDF
jgi:hypothetical protein